MKSYDKIVAKPLNGVKPEEFLLWSKNFNLN